MVDPRVVRRRLHAGTHSNARIGIDRRRLVVGLAADVSEVKRVVLAELLLDRKVPALGDAQLEVRNECRWNVLRSGEE